MQCLGNIVQCVTAGVCHYVTDRIAAKTKIRFAPQRGDSSDQFTSNFARPTGTWVRLAVQNFTSIGEGGGNATTKISKIP